MPCSGGQPLTYLRCEVADRRDVGSLSTGMQVPRLVDLEILARGKAALERL
jgi:hypothetical protein